MQVPSVYSPGSPQTLSTMQLVREWQESIGLSFAKPEVNGEIVHPEQEPLRARRQMYGRIGTIFARAFTLAYPQCNKLVNDPISGDVWETGEIPAPVHSLGKKISENIATVRREWDEWKGREDVSGAHPAWVAFGEGVQLSTTAFGSPTAFCGQISNPATFGVRKIWSTHQIIPDLLMQAEVMPDTERCSHIADCSRSLPIALAHVHYALIRCLFSKFENGEEQWQKDAFLLRSCGRRSGYGVELKPTVFVRAKEEVNKRELQQYLQKEEVVGCPVLHVSREGSSRSMASELHDLVGAMAKQYYAHLFRKSSLKKNYSVRF